MILTFPVGEPPHTVEFSWDQMWGRLSITVDGNSVVDTVRTFSVSTVKTYEFEVGEDRHQVKIEKRRATFFAGFRPQHVYAFVDGVLVAQGESGIGK